MDETSELNKNIVTVANKIVDTNQDDWLHIGFRMALLGISIYIGAYIAGLGWKAAGAA